MEKLTEDGNPARVVTAEGSDSAGDEVESVSLVDGFGKTADIQQEGCDVVVGDELDALSLMDAFEKPLDVQQVVEATNGEVPEDEQTQAGDDASVCDSKWSVGAKCQAVWSEDGQVYSATVIAVDSNRCRVRFTGYGNEEDVELSALKSPDQASAANVTQDWKAGSRCRAVYSEDGLVYPGMVMWVKGQRCRVRFDNYNNEEEQDVSGLLTFDELLGPSRAAATTKASKWKTSSSSSSDWKRKTKEENQGERGGGEGRGAMRRDEQSCTSSSWVKDRVDPQRRGDKDCEDRRRGHLLQDGVGKPTNHSFPLFPPFPPPHPSLGDPLSFIPPPPPLWMSGGKEVGGVDDLSNMLMLWYMCGFHTGSYVAQQRQNKSTSRD